jgi:hypothetical protein
MPRIRTSTATIVGVGFGYVTNYNNNLFVFLKKIKINKKINKTLKDEMILGIK